MLADQVVADHLPADEVLLDNAFQHGRVAVAVPGSFGIDDGHRPARADPQAIGLGPIDPAGAGQPQSTTEVKEKRAKGLYRTDKMTKIRSSEANPVIEPIYRNLIKDQQHRLLHVHYHGNPESGN